MIVAELVHLWYNLNMSSEVLKSSIQTPIGECMQEISSLVSSGKLPATSEEGKPIFFKELVRKFHLQEVAYVPLSFPQGIKPKPEQYRYKEGALSMSFRFDEPPIEEAIVTMIEMISKIGGSLEERAPIVREEIYPKDVLKSVPLLPGGDITFSFPIEVMVIRKRRIFRKEERVKKQSQAQFSLMYYPLPRSSVNQRDMELFMGAKTSKYQGIISCMVEDSRDPRIQEAINLVAINLFRHKSQSQETVQAQPEKTQGRIQGLTTVSKRDNSSLPNPNMEIEPYYSKLTLTEKSYLNSIVKKVRKTNK